MYKLDSYTTQEARDFLCIHVRLLSYMSNSQMENTRWNRKDKKLVEDQIDSLCTELEPNGTNIWDFFANRNAALRKQMYNGDYLWYVYPETPVNPRALHADKDT